MNPAGGEVFTARKNALLALIDKLQLDALLLYSERSSSPFSKWIAGVNCTSACHYFYLDRAQAYFLEVSYRAQDLRSRTSEQVLEVADEDAFASALASQTKSCKHIGVAGLAPWAHLNNLGCQISDISPRVAPLLAQKSPEEQCQIGGAAKLLSDSLSCLGPILKPGVSERALSASFLGALFPKVEGFPFSASFVSGERLKSSTVGAPTDRCLGENDCLLVDAGLTWQGFQADCTRMYFLGESKAKDSYNKLCQAHELVIPKLGPGITAGEVLELYRAGIDAAGLAADTLDIPCLGHGIGFALHEHPLLFRESERGLALQPGMIFTLEPEITAAGLKLRVEDMVLMTASGSRKLT